MSAQNTSQELLYAIRTKTSSTKSFIAKHECSQLNCRAFDTTSSDSDAEERIRTKATTFFKAYPKVCSSKHQSSSSEPNWSDRSDLGEAKTTNHSTEPVKSKVGPQNMVRNKENTSKVSNGNRFIPKADWSSNSEEDDRNNNSSQYRLVQSQYYRSHNDVSCNKSTGGRLETGKSCSNYIEVLSTPNYDKSSSETENLSEDHYTDKRNAIVPSTSPIGTKTISLIKSRPFKSYPEDPLAVTVGLDTARMTFNRGKPENYNDFRRRMIGKRDPANVSGVNSNMRRFYASETSDSLYKEKRMKNNMAARRSRYARRVKEDELAVRCAYLEQENMFLKKKMSELEQEKGKCKMDE